MSVAGILDAMRSDLPPAHRLIWQCLENHANGRRWWPITIEALAAELSLSRATVIRALTVLEERAIIRREYRLCQSTVVHMLRTYDGPIGYSLDTQTPEMGYSDDTPSNVAPPPSGSQKATAPRSQNATTTTPSRSQKATRGGLQNATTCTHKKERTNRKKEKEGYPPLIPPKGGEADRVCATYPSPDDAQQGETAPSDAGRGTAPVPVSDRPGVALGGNSPLSRPPQDASGRGAVPPPPLSLSASPSPRQRAPSEGQSHDAARGEPSGFGEFYAAYPRKVGRRAAAKAFDLAIRRGSKASDIVAGLRRATFSDDPQFRPHPATWLNQDRWLDDPTPPPAASPAFDPRKLTGFAAVAWEARRELAELDAADAAEAALSGAPALIEGRLG